MAHRIRRIGFLDHAEDIGGAEQSLLELVPQIDRRRYEPIIMHSAAANWVNQPALADVRHVAAVQSSAVLGAKRDELKPGVLASWQHLHGSRRLALSLRRTILEDHIDLVHTNALKSHLLGGLAARLARRPVVWHMRDILTEPAARKWLLQAARMINPYVIAISEAVAEQFAPLRDRLQLRVVHNGIPLDKFRPEAPPPGLREELGLSERDQVVLVVGRLTPWKGHRTLLEAMKLVRERHPRARLLVVGAVTFWEAAYESELRAKAEAEGVADIVQWLGFRYDVAEVLRLCDVFVLPSVGEPFGRAIVEAMASEKPVVGIRAGGVPEVIKDGETGLLVRPHDPQELALALSRLLDDPEQARQMGEAGRRRANRYFDIRRVAREVQEVYVEVLGRS
ncbi:MAG: glycosyltransferase family 4 protein [Bacteroidota bacterium]